MCGYESCHDDCQLPDPDPDPNPDPEPEWLAGPWRLGRVCFVVSLDDAWVGLWNDRQAGVVYLAPVPCCILGIRYRALDLVRTPRG